MIAGYKLTAEQRARYERMGFVIVPEVFSRDELAEINAEIDRLREDASPERDSDYFIFSLGLRSPTTQAVCRDERILALIEDIVAPGIAIYSAKMVEKPAGDERPCHWHQDNAYYNPHCASVCRMSIWLPLQDTDERNGGLWVVPGSHKGGVLPWEDRRSTGECSRAFADGWEQREGAVPVRMKAGELLLFHADLQHRSLGNATDRPRRAFIVSYQEATAPRGNGAQHQVLRAA